MAEWLVDHGIASISANIDSVTKIRQAVAKTEHRILLEAARRTNA
jgi:pyruvate,water dikinase